MHTFPASLLTMLKHLHSSTLDILLCSQSTGLSTEQGSHWSIQLTLYNILSDTKPSQAMSESSAYTNWTLNRRGNKLSQMSDVAVTVNYIHSHWKWYHAQWALANDPPSCKIWHLPHLWCQKTTTTKTTSRNVKAFVCRTASHIASLIVILTITHTHIFPLERKERKKAKMYTTFVMVGTKIQKQSIVSLFKHQNTVIVQSLVVGMDQISLLSAVAKPNQTLLNHLNKENND